MRRFPLLLFVAFACFAAVAQVRIDVDFANPPFMMERKGAAAGIYPAIIKSVCRKMGESCEVSPKPWARALLEIDQGHAGIGGVYKTGERLKKYDYSEPIFVERLQVYFAKDRAFPFQAHADLRGRTVGVIRAWSYGDDFDQMRKAGALKVEETTSDALNFAKLNQGRLDAVIAVAEAGDALLRSGRYANVVAGETLLASNPAHLAFNKSADMTAWLRRFDIELASYRKSGELAKVVNLELQAE